MPRSPGYRHADDTRKKIKAAQLINRLHNHAMAAAPILDASQVNAIKILLGKVLPDLKTNEITGEGGGPIQFDRIECVIVSPKNKNG